MKKKYIILILITALIIGITACTEDSDNPLPKGTAPAAPSELEADALTGATVKLTWQDNADDEEGFTLQRSLSSDFSSVEVVKIDSDELKYIERIRYRYNLFLPDRGLCR